VTAGGARRIWLTLGGNLGDRLANLRFGLDELVSGGVAIDAVSSVYDTPPWPNASDPRFANIAVSGHCALSARELLRLCKRIEAAAGRDFDAPRNSPRPLDIDIVAIDGEQLDEPDLKVPHALMQDRAFVLMPLAEVAEGFVHPGLGQTAAELLDAVETDGVTVFEARGWWQGMAG
jgi:2-amino-4-hydroxy-6-hydroxymethyldihydropteridine diphosphokinase